MTILNNKKKTIEISITNKVQETLATKGFMLKLPTVICSDRVDAVTMQQRINSFVYELAQERLGKNE